MKKAAGGVFASLKSSMTSLKSANTSHQDALNSPTASKTRMRTQSVSSSRSTSGSLSSIISRKSKSRTQLLVINTASDIISMDEQSIKSPSPIDQKKLNSLQKAVYSGDVKKVKALLTDKKRDVNKLDTYHGFTALHIAAEENQVEIAGILLDPSKALSPKDSKKISEFATSPLKKCDVNCVNQENRTPLTMAVIRGHLDMIRFLLDNGADPDSVDLLGCTPLHYAVVTGNNQALGILLKHASKPEAIDKSGFSYLQHAIRLKDESMAESLINFRVPVNYVTLDDKSTALHLAAEQGLESTVRLLLQKGADPSILDSKGRSALARTDRTHHNQDLIDILTVKMLEKEAREELGKKNFLDAKDGETSRSVTPVPVEETAVEAVDFVGGNRRVQQGFSRESDVVYAKKRGVKSGARKKGEVTRQPGDPLELDSMYLSDEELNDGQSQLELSDPSSDDDLSISEESDSEMFSALGLSKADRHKKKESLSSESLSMVREQSEQEAPSFAGNISRVKPSIEASRIDEDIDLDSDIPEDEDNDKISEIDPHRAYKLPSKYSASKKTSINSEITEESDLLDALGIETEEISAITESNIGSLKSQPLKEDSSSSPSLSISNECSSKEYSQSDQKEESNDDDTSQSRSDPKEELSSLSKTSSENKPISGSSGTQTSGRQDKDPESDDDVSNQNELPVQILEPVYTDQEQRLETDSLEDPGEISAFTDEFSENVLQESPISSQTPSTELPTLPPLPNDSIAPKSDGKDLEARIQPSVEFSYFSEPNSFDDSQTFLSRLEDLADRLDGNTLNPVVITIQKMAAASKTFRENVLSVEAFVGAIKRAVKDRTDGLKDLEEKNRHFVEEVLGCVDEKVKEAKDPVEFEITKLQFRIKELDDHSKASLESAKAKENVIDHLTSEVTQLTTYNAQLMERIEEEEKEKNELYGRAKGFEEEIKSSEVAMRELRKQIEEVKAENDLLMQDKSKDDLQQALLDDRKAHAAIVEGLMKQIEGLQTDNTTYISTIAALKVEFDTKTAKDNQSKVELEESIDIVKKQLSSEIEKRSASNRETKYLRQILKGYGASVESLNMNEFDAGNESDDELDENPFKKYCHQLEEDCLELQKRLAHETEDRATLERQIEEARFHSEEVSDELQELARALKTEKKASLALEERLAILNLELDSRKELILHLEDQLKDKDAATTKQIEELGNANLQIEKLQRSHAKALADLEAIQDEKSSYLLQIEARNSQIEALRTQLKEIVLKQQNAEMNPSTAMSDARKEISEDIIQYYENEIKLLNQQFDEEKEYRIARDGEHKRVLASLCELEEKLLSLKTLYEKQLSMCQDLEAAKTKAETDLEILHHQMTDQKQKIHEMEVAAIKTKTILAEMEAAETELKLRIEKDELARKEEMEQLKKIVRGLEKDKFDLDMMLNTTKLMVEEKSCRVVEHEKRIELVRGQNESLEKEVKELNKRLLSQREEYESVTDEKHSQFDTLKQTIKERDKTVEGLEKEIAELQSRIQEVQTTFERKLRESEQHRLCIKSDLEDVQSELERVQASLAAAKSRCTGLEADLTTITEERDNTAAKFKTLTKMLEVEKKKSERFFKSTDNLRTKLSSFVDLSPVETTELPTSPSIEIRQPNTKIPCGNSTSTFDISGQDSMSTLRDIRTFMSSEVRSIEYRLSSLGEELQRDLSRIASLQRDISADVEMDSEIRDLIIKFLQSQTTRVSESRTTIQTTKLSLTTTTKEVESGLDSVREVIEKESRRSKYLKEELEKTSVENGVAIEEMKKKKGAVQQLYAECLAKVEVLEEERSALQKRLKEGMKENFSLQERVEGCTGTDEALKEAKAKLGKAEANLKSSEAVVEGLEDKLSKSVKDKQKLESKFQKTEKELDSKEKEVCDLNKKLKETVSEKSILETRILQLDKTLTESRAELQKRTHDLESTLKETRETITSLKTETAELKRHTETLKQKLAETVETNRSLQKLHTDNELNWTRRRTELENDLHALTQGRTRLEAEKTRLEDQLCHLRETAEESKTRIAQLEKAQAYLEQERREVSSTSQVQEAQMKKLRGELEDALGIQRRLEMERNSLREELSSRSRFDLKMTEGSEPMIHEKSSWDIEKRKLVEELERRTSSLVQAERDSLAVARQLKEATSKFHALQARTEVDQDTAAALTASKGWQEEKKVFEKTLEEERNHRRDVEMRGDRIRRQLEEEIASLTSARKRLEERESFTEHQRRSSDMKVHELQDVIETERAMKHKLREELHNIMINMRNVEGEYTALRRKMDSQESPELTKALRTRHAVLEEENLSLKAKLQNAETRLIGIEARAKASFDDKLRKVAMRLEEQSREREKLEKFREQTEQETRERYERHIQKLVTELDTVKRVVDLHGTAVAAGRGRNVWHETHDLKDELYRQIESLKRSNQRLESKFKGLESFTASLSSVPDEHMRNNGENLRSKKLRFAELLSEEDLSLKHAAPPRISKLRQQQQHDHSEDPRRRCAPQENASESLQAPADD
ncbi:hypothetical protein HDU67_004011 [Dinochytrium kinnereticum]|nr:hypothetical protein HDU67_004011 [Dinochytrium kinnereticum]